MTAHDSMHPDSKVHGANMGPIWGRQDPGGPHVGPMNFDIWVITSQFFSKVGTTLPMITRGKYGAYNQSKDTNPINTIMIRHYDPIIRHHTPSFHRDTTVTQRWPDPKFCDAIVSLQMYRFPSNDHRFIVVFHWVGSDEIDSANFVGPQVYKNFLISVPAKMSRQ